MLYRVIIAVCSQTHKKHKYGVWAERKFAECSYFVSYYSSKNSAVSQH